MPALFSKKEDKKTKASEEVKHEHVHEHEDAVEAVGGLAVPKGEDSQAYQIILKPHVTEKAGLGNTINKYTFKVSKNANKIEVKKAIEKLYNVKVDSVNIQNMPSKSRQVGRYLGTKSGFKKATVTLKEGQKIEVV